MRNFSLPLRVCTVLSRRFYFVFTDDSSLALDALSLWAYTEIILNSQRETESKRMIWFYVFLIAFVFLLHFLAIAPAKKRLLPDHPLCGRTYAHRGLHSLRNQVPENSMPAFSYAASRGYGIELDVRLSADGQVVVFHDDNLSRMTGDPRRVESVPAAELCAMSLDNTSHTIPLFADVLAEVRGRVPLIVEIKPDSSREELCRKVLETLEGYEGLYCVESFDPRVLYWFRRHAPQVIRGQLSTRMKLAAPRLNPILAFALTNLYCNFISRPHFIAYDYNFFDTPNLRTLRTRYGAANAAWTIDNFNDYENCVHYAQMVIFEGIQPPQQFHDPRDRVARHESTIVGDRRPGGNR